MKFPFNCCSLALFHLTVSSTLANIKDDPTLSIRSKIKTNIERRQIVTGLEQWTPYGEFSGSRFEGGFGEYVSLSFDGTRLITSGFDSVKTYQFNSESNSWENEYEFDRSFTERGLVPVAVSSDGSTVVLGGMFNNELGIHAGAALVFRLDEQDGTTWNQLGRTMLGDDENDLFGFSVAISKFGNYVVVGAKIGEYVRLFSYNERIGRFDVVQTFVDGESNIAFGHDVAISGRGDRVVVGAPHGLQNKGFVRTYDIDLVTERIINVENVGGPFADDRFGSQVTLSEDGLTLGVSTFEDGSQLKEDFVRIFRYDVGTGDANWVRTGSDIDFESAGLGGSISISADGTMLALGIVNDDDITRLGMVAIYEYDGSDWEQYIEAITGTESFELCGTSIAISPDGSSLAYGCPGSNDLISRGGKVYVAATLPSEAPSFIPSSSPSQSPSMATSPPTQSPIDVVQSPTQSPIQNPTQSPIPNPPSPTVSFPTGSPVNSPVSSPTSSSVTSPTASPVISPVTSPASSPTSSTTSPPSKLPTIIQLEPTSNPSNFPTDIPSTAPSRNANSKQISDEPTSSNAGTLDPCVTVLKSLLRLAM